MSSPNANTATALPQAVAPQAGLVLRATTTHQVQKQQHRSTQSAAEAVGTSLLALVLVIGLIVVLGKLAKRLPGVGAAAGSSALRIVASLALGPKDRAVVIDVNGTQLLVGIGVNGPRLLHQLEEPLPVPEAKPSLSFSDVLAQLRKPK